MPFAVEHKLIRAVAWLHLPGAILADPQIGVLEHLGEQEALLVVLLVAPVLRVDIAHARKARLRPARRIDRDKRIPHPVAVLPVARHPVCVVEALHDLRPQDVAAVRDVEPGALVQIALFGRQLLLVPRERLRPDVGRCLRVCLVAGAHQIQPEVDQLLVAQHRAAQQEAAAVEAGQMARAEIVRAVLVRRQEGQLRARRRVRRQVCLGRLRRRHPAVLVEPKARRVVHVQLDQVFVERVVAAVPADGRVGEVARLEVDGAAHQTRERLAAGRLRVQQMRLGLLAQSCVLRVAGQVAQARPFQHQGAH